MKPRDLDRERSEKKITLAEFLKIYNAEIPSGFPKASKSLLEEYQREYAGQFKQGSDWSLDLHRKKIMDWLPMRLRPVDRLAQGATVTAINQR